MDEAFLHKLREIVEEHLDDEQFGVSDLARQAGKSRSQIHRKLNNLTGKSTSQFIREIRLEHAMEMLRENVATASEISYRVGFSSPTYFSTCFHQRYGFPPGEAADKSDEEIKAIQKTKEHQASTTPTISVQYKSKLYPLLFALTGLLLVGGYFYFQSSNNADSGNENYESIAVLPLDNLTGDPDKIYFVDGLHDALIGELGKLNRLRVISRTSTIPFKETVTNVREIAERLNVDNIMEGSVYSAGDSLRIQLQLIGIQPKEHHLWAKAYHSNLSGVLNILNDVSREVSREIQLTLSPEEQNRLNRTVSVNKNTYEAYLMGMFFIKKNNPEDVKKGLNYLHDAVEKNPADPMAYAGLAQGYINLGHGPTPSQDAFLKAKAAAKTAIKLDSTLAEAHSALGSYKLYHERDWKGAERAFKRANELNPSLPWNHYHYAWYLHLAGREKEAISEHELAHELDPLNPYISGWLAWLYADYGYHKEANQAVTQTLRMDEQHPIALLAQARSFIGQKKYKEAVPLLEKAASHSPARKGALGHCLVLAGKKERAQKVLDELLGEEMNSYNALQLASIYAGMGKNDEAFKWLSYEPSHGVAPWAARMVRFDSLRSDPRYEQFLNRFNLHNIEQVSAVSSYR